jgi:hypothetical protein
MPVKNPRINVVLEKPLYHVIEQLASKDGVSLSLKVRPREKGPGDRGGHSTFRICREKGSEIHEEKSIETP